ncbi:MAG: PqqD family protein [Elusimicrobia bacterium]|nr:PqqD family protein [Elusimicrobiota bacterium]
MQKKDSAEQRFKRAAHTAFRRIEDEGVVLDLRSSAYYSLNETARAVWEGLNAGLSVAAVAEKLSSEFDETPAKIEGDVVAIVAQLSKDGLIEPRS